LASLASRRRSARRVSNSALALALGFRARLLGRDPHEKALLAAQDGTRRIGDEQGAIAVVVTGQVSGRHQLTEDRLPGRLVRILADAENGELVVARPRHAIVCAPHQHIDEIGGAETLPGAVHRGQRLLRQHGAVHRLRRADAVIAIATRLRLPLAEIGEQRLPAAARQLA
jgi:hypothetical protein